MSYILHNINVPSGWLLAIIRNSIQACFILYATKWAYFLQPQQIYSTVSSFWIILGQHIFFSYIYDFF